LRKYLRAARTPGDVVDETGFHGLRINAQSEKTRTHGLVFRGRVFLFHVLNEGAGGRGERHAPGCLHVLHQAEVRGVGLVDAVPTNRVVARLSEGEAALRHAIEADAARPDVRLEAVVLRRQRDVSVKRAH
jgi:hypothetical protein